MFVKNRKFILSLSTVSVVFAFVGLFVLLLLRSPLSLALYIGFWVLTNIAGGVICAQCPFRSKRCPGVYQLYFMTYLSRFLYRKAEYSEKTRKASVLLVSLFGSLYYLVGFGAAFVLYWHDLVVVVGILLGFFVLHLILSFLYLCPNCLNKEKCPMAKISKNIGRIEA